MTQDKLEKAQNLMLRIKRLENIHEVFNKYFDEKANDEYYLQALSSFEITGHRSFEITGHQKIDFYVNLTNEELLMLDNAVVRHIGKLKQEFNVL